MKSVSPPSANAAKPLQCRVLVGADESVLPDWKQRRIAVAVPMNMPIGPFLERHICSRLNWKNLNDAVLFTAHGATVDSVKPTDDRLQILLTPRQLGWAPESINWAWMKKPTGRELPLLTSNDMYRERLVKFYNYYDPEGLERIDALLTDFQGNEELLLLRLASKYGSEPSKEMMHKKRVLLEQQAGLRGVTPGQRSFASSSTKQVPNFSRLSLLSGLSNMSMLLGRGFTGMIRKSYYIKWLHWMRTRRLQRRIVHSLTASIDSFRRRRFFMRWSQYARESKTKRHLTVSTKLVVKQETVVGTLNEENVELRQKVQDLQALVEVLEANNARRLGPLVSSSEAAVAQLKTLSKELQDKDRLLNDMERRMLQMGNKLLAAADEKARLEEALAELRADYDSTVGALNRRVEEQEAQFLVVRSEMDEMRPKTPPDRCRHCRHFYEAVKDFEVARARSQHAIERLEAAEREKRDLQSALAALSEKLEVAQKQQAPPVVSAVEAPSAAHRIAPPHGSRDTALVESVHAEETAEQRPASPIRSTGVDVTAAASTMSPSRHDGPLYSLPPRERQEVSLSMLGFFEREEKLAVEKGRQSLERQTAPRYNSAPRAGASRYNVKPVSEPNVASQHMSDTAAAVQGSLAYSAIAPGLPGGAPVQLASNTALTASAAESVLSRPIAVRPHTNPLRRTFGTVQSSDPRAMRSELFQYAPHGASP